MKNRIVILLASISMLLTGCGGSKCPVVEPDKLYSTPYTDKLAFAQADKLEGAHFASTSEDSSSYEHYGYVSLKSVTDGDTANFAQEGYVDDSNKPITIKTRFLGVNTPESTAKVEPWGKKASLFTKHILEEAQAKADEESVGGKTVCNIALITDPATMGERDSSGNRWLAFVWYRKSSSDKWRNLNLELVEQGYSRNQLFTDSKVCDYRKSFEAAGAHAEKCGIRVPGGQSDPDYDYTEQTYEYSLWGIQKHFDEIGISDSGSSGFQLIVTALVVGIQGDSLYLRDLLIDEEQFEEEGESARLAGLYAYAGFNSALCSTLQNYSKAHGGDETGVGLVVRFYARATLYSNNVQLSDIKTGTTGKTAFRILDESNFSKYKESLSWSHKYKEDPDFTFADLNTAVTPVTLDTSKIDKNNGDEDCIYTDLLAYQYQWVTVEMTIRDVKPADDDEQPQTTYGAFADSSDSYWRTETPDSKAYTVYAYITDKNGEKVYTNIRIDASLQPYVSKESWGTADRFDCTSANSPVGHTYRIVGYFARYFNKFQVQLGNNYPSYNYITRIA